MLSIFPIAIMGSQMARRSRTQFHQPSRATRILLVLFMASSSCNKSVSPTGQSADAAPPDTQTGGDSYFQASQDSVGSDIGATDRDVASSDTGATGLPDAHAIDDATDAGRPSLSALPAMAMPRKGHTATSLRDGRVLIVGGRYDIYDSKATNQNTTKTTATAELYDPATESFAPTGALSTARTGHTATLLADGRVLIAAGSTGTAQSATAELYDPATGTFRSTGALLAARSVHTATLLDDGEVLVVGGYGASGLELASCELYDPTTGTFAATASLASARYGHTSTLLANGKVLLAGGSAHNLKDFATAELYDPATRGFSTTGPLSARRDGHTATRLADGRVLIAGGEGDGDPSLGKEDFASAELYDPATGTFSMTGSMATQRFGHTASLLASGMVLIAAGMNHLSTATYFAGAEIFDSTTGTFAPAGTLVSARTGHQAVSLTTGKVLVVGGLKGENSAEVYDPIVGTFYSHDLPRESHTATPLPNGKVVISAVPDPMNEFATGHAALYDPGAGEFLATGTMVSARRWHTATLLASNKVLFAGGGFWTNTTSLLRGEIYDPDTGSFTATGAMTWRRRHTATLLTDGRVLLAGGATDASTTEIFDPATSAFTLSSPMTTARDTHTATRLRDGSVLVAGGWGSSSATLESAEIYDPAAGSFAATGGLATSRSGHTATLLPDGRVLVVGGMVGNGLQLGNLLGKASCNSRSLRSLHARVLDRRLADHGAFRPRGSRPVRWPSARAGWF